MTNIEQAGLIFIAVIALMVIGGIGLNRKSRLRDEDSATWWFARRDWWKDRP